LQVIQSPKVHYSLCSSHLSKILNCLLEYFSLPGVPTAVMSSSLYPSYLAYFLICDIVSANI
jgi:hypothetical protein